MRYLFLALTLACTTLSPMADMRVENLSPAPACEVCQMKDASGAPCKGRVTKGSSSPSGVNYTCSNGHRFFVKSKIRVN